MRPFLNILLLTSLGLASCRRSGEESSVGADFESWRPRYNLYISNWLNEQVVAASESLEQLQEQLGEASDPAAGKNLGERIKDKQKELDRFKARQELGDYLAILKAKDVPDGLLWENGQDQPDIGDPASRKGGSFRYFITESLYNGGADANPWFSIPPPRFCSGSVLVNLDSRDLLIHKVLRTWSPGAH